MFLFTGCCKTEGISGKDSNNEMLQAEPYIFYVRNLDEVRQDGKRIEDFYITNTGNSWSLYYINSANQLYGYRSGVNVQEDQIEMDAENNSMQLIAENIVHVDCGDMMDYTIFLTAGGNLYGMGYSKSGVLLSESEDYYEEPLLLMKGVKYALCGYGDIVILKDDNSVWTWGTKLDRNGKEYAKRELQPVKILENAIMISGKRDCHAALLEDGTVWTWGSNFYDMCGVPKQEVIDEPVCVAEDAAVIWMGKLQINDGCLNWEKWHHYGYDAGYNDNLVIKKNDGSLWTCGKNIENTETYKMQDGIVYTHGFMPCEIRQTPYIKYDGINTYISILEEYDRAVRDKNCTQEQCKEIDETFNIYNRNEAYVLCYCLSDLTNDGTKELILGFLHEGEYSVNAIYAYDEGIIVSVIISWERELNLYNQGIIKEILESGGKSYYYYAQLQKDSGLMNNLISISKSSESLNGGETEEMKYYRDTEGKDEITEEEFNNIIDQYESVPIELEWNVLDGFCDTEDTASNNFEFHHIEELVLNADFISQEEIQQIGKMQSLKKLAFLIDDENIDLSPLAKLINLEELEIQSCIGECYELDTQPLGKLENLKKISLMYCSFDTSFLKELSEL